MKEIRRKIRELDRVEGGLVPRGGCARHGKRTRSGLKCKFFDDKIEEISHTELRPWDLMSWTKPRKQDAVKAILHKGSPCLATEDTWNVFQDTFNAAHSRDAYSGRLGSALNPKPKWDWAPFFGKEITEALTGCSGRSAPGPDHLTWSHIKILVLDESI